MNGEGKAREALASFGKSMFERGLSFGSAGNLSMRVEDGWLMTPTNVSLGRLDPARISMLAIAFVVLRVLHGFFYLVNIHALRSLAWFAGFAVVVWLMAQAAMHVA